MEATITTGASAEDRATAALIAAGFAIVHRNWTCKAGELDLVAREGEVLVFVEVRSRTQGGHGRAAEMISASKRAQVARIAELYLRLERPRITDVRFDVVAVTGEVLEHVRDAWRLGG